ncbi:MAG: PQQ-dependent sugar dehydrogenase [Chitinophagales bacterium]|nr:PQQ-dependent sugar dehydrogenase [Chitinophagales bacterium]MDW8427517.1 PQQ-dependent sugar dehydrogenase [Chitinophagales bacterium]
MKSRILPPLVFFFPIAVQAQLVLQLEQIASGFVRPIQVVHAGDNRLFIVEQRGVIYVRQPDGTTSVFLDIDPKVKSTGNEQGLLGLAFHPNYATNGYFYVNYINNSNNTVIARYSVSSGNPNVADANSEVILLTITQPFNNHNGGDLKFGPDGYLYCALGDGGGVGDPGNRAQDINQLLGKILRIDVNSGSPYGIPPSNPFVGVPGADEIWSLGWRNPWRFSFDRLTGDMWIGDVGQYSWEEVNFEPAGSPGGRNYGWRCYEGNAVYNFSLCNTSTSFTFPVLAYDHTYANGGFSVIGGFVYRGTQNPGMYGHYITCDYVSGNFWTLYPNGSGGFITTFIPNLMAGIASFGEGHDGELYATNIGDGAIYRLYNACDRISLSFSVTPATAEGYSDGAIDLTVNQATTPITYLWSNGATTQDLTNLADGTYTVTVTDGKGCVKMASVLVPNGCSQLSLSFHVTNASAEGVSDGAINLTVHGATPPLTYQWSTGATTEDLSGLPDGNYTVTVTDWYGCTASGTAVVANNCGAVTNVIESDLTATSITISWTPFGATSFTFTYNVTPNGPKTKIKTSNTSVHLTGLLPNTKYKYTIKNNCPNTSVKFKYSDKFTTLASRMLAGASAEPYLYPNPGHDFVHLRNLNNIQRICISDPSGRTVYKAESGEQETLIVPVATWPKGLYLVSLTDVQGIEQVLKLVVQ